MISVTAKTNVSGLTRFAAELGAAVAKGNAETAQDIAEVASRNSAAYADTGAESESYYVVAPAAGIDTYDESVSRGEARNRKSHSSPKQSPSNPETATVANSRDYHAINEFGAPARNRPARAPLRRAVESVRPRHAQRIATNMRKLAADSGIAY